VTKLTEAINEHQHIEMSEEIFWDIVDAIDWANTSKKRWSYETVRKRLGERLTLTEVEDLRSIASIASDILDRKIGPDHNPAGGGDDAHSDFCYHIIGLGSKEFYSSLADYDRIEQRGNNNDYVESFVYCLPWPIFKKTSLRVA
jgi:hypothetical protein